MKKTTAIRYIDDNTAQVTKAFMKQASIFGTDEFKLWREYKKEFPSAKMVTKSIKKNPDQKTRRNMTFANMEAFIKTQANSEELEDEFKTIKQRSKIQKSPYQYVLEWFEAKFDGYDNMDAFMKEKEAERVAAQNEGNNTLTITAKGA